MTDKVRVIKNFDLNHISINGIKADGSLWLGIGGLAEFEPNPTQEQLDEVKEESAIQSNIVEPYKRSSLICACGNKQQSVYPAFTQIKDLQCGKCSRNGYLQLQNENAKIDSSFWERRVCENCNKELGEKACTNSKGEGRFCSYDCSEPKKSIWKPVSELPYYSCKILVKYNHHKEIILCDNIQRSISIGGIDADLDLVKEFCLFSDFINQQEDLRARVEGLEKLLK